MTYAFIIAIENYKFSNKETYGISPVDFATNDAKAFIDVAKTYFKADHIVPWINENATIEKLSNDLPHAISQCKPEDKIIFYYAGHGFYNKNTNWLTCWDSHGQHLETTTVSFQDTVVTPLQKAGCKQALLFLDCCSTYLTEKFPSRDFIFNISDEQIKKNSEMFKAAYFSCRPGEKSFPAKGLNHGVWTFHLINALKGNVKEVIANSKYITSGLLQNYLSTAIPKYNDSVFIKSPQNPFAEIASNGEFTILEVPQNDINITAPTLKKILITFEGDQPDGMGGSQMFLDKDDLNNWITQRLVDKFKKVAVEENRFKFTRKDDYEGEAFLKFVPDDYVN